MHGRAAGLRPPGVEADTTRMLDMLIQELGGSSDWRIVLEAYRSRQVETRNSVRDAESWTPRLFQIHGVDQADLPRLHGKLIALGLLKFELSGRTAGVQYQLSLLGRQTLDAGLPLNGQSDHAEFEADEELEA